MQSIGRPPAGLFDVQIAAGLIGVEYPAGYGNLLSKVLGLKVKKHETRTDWQRRPLSKKQIEYALFDALHLEPLYETLTKRLAELGRLGVDGRRDVHLEDRFGKGPFARTLAAGLGQFGPGRPGAGDFAGAVSVAGDARPIAAISPPGGCCATICSSNWPSADRPIRSKFKPCAAWNGAISTRRVDALSACISKALELPEEECPRRIPVDQMPQLSVLGQFLFAALGSLCRESQLAPALVGTPNDIRELIVQRTHQVKSKKTPRLAKGWRAHFVGELFDELLDGKIAVRVTAPAEESPLSFEKTKK